MITTILTFIVFFFGFMAAFIDWNQFLNDLLDSQKIKHKAQIVAGISITLVGFYLIMYLPA